jgi:hypothetical protein
MHDRDLSASEDPVISHATGDAATLDALSTTLKYEPDPEARADAPLDRWLDDPDDLDPGPPPTRPRLDPAAEAELHQLRTRLALTKARSELLRDPGWLDELTAAEQDADREAAAQVRAMRREQHLAAAVAEDRLSDRARRADSRLARMELSDQLWSRRALARHKRLLDPTARLASLHRTHVASSAVLIAIAIAGITWTAAGVHDTLVGPHGALLAYIVEPIFSLPLLVIMAVSARAAQWDRAFPPPDQRAQVYTLETFLLIATIAMNTVSALPRVGSWQGFATLLAHLVPPVLIVIAVVLQPLIAAFLAGILTAGGAGIDATDSTPVRLTPDTALILRLVSQVRAAERRGELTAWAQTGLPSISAIQRYLRCEKRRAQVVWDALRILSGHRTGHRHPSSVSPDAVFADRGAQ